MCCAQAYAMPAGTSDAAKCHACQSQPSLPVRLVANTSSAAWPNSRDLPARTNASGDAEEDAAEEEAGRAAASEVDSPPRPASPETHRRVAASARGGTPQRVSHAAALAEHAPLVPEARVPLACQTTSTTRAARRIICAPPRARHTEDERFVLGRVKGFFRGAETFTIIFRPGVVK